MHITCEGKAYELFEGATPQNLWNMVSGGRDPCLLYTSPSPRD